MNNMVSDMREKHVDIVEYTKLGMKKRVEKLIEEGKDVNERDLMGDCAVLCAAERNDLTILRMLVEAGASLDVQGANGVTPLSYAMHNKSSEMVDYINSNTNKCVFLQ